MATIDVAGKPPRGVSPGLESVLREWREKSAAYFGFPIPVQVIAQSDSPYAGDRNSVNTAIINPRGGNDWALLVILADVANAEDELIAHEILHKTLEIEGYRDLRHQETPNSQVQTILNSMLAHIPLNERMRRHGLDPSVIEESKARGGLERIDRYRAFEGTVPVLMGTCLYTDSILQASQELSEAIRRGIRKFPEVSRLSEAVIATVRQHDLSRPEEYRALCHDEEKEMRLLQSSVSTLFTNAMHDAGFNLANVFRCNPQFSCHFVGCLLLRDEQVEYAIVPLREFTVDQGESAAVKCLYFVRRVICFVLWGCDLLELEVGVRSAFGLGMVFDFPEVFEDDDPGNPTQPTPKGVARFVPVKVHHLRQDYAIHVL